MTQIRWDRQTDGQAGRHSAESWSKLHMDSPPPMPGLQGAVLYNIQVSHFSAKYSAKKKKKHTALPTQHFSQFLHVFTAYGQIYMCVIHIRLYGYAVCVCSGRCAYIPACMRVLCACALRTPSAPHKILKGEDGDVRVLRLAGDVSWSSAELWAVIMVVWPTHSLLPCSPPRNTNTTTTITLVFPLSKWPSCLRRFLLLIAGGEYSLDVQQGPNSFELLLRSNSDFRGFHSWVDTDVLVSAIMGPLSFHANWSGKAELRGCQYREGENL